MRRAGPVMALFLSGCGNAKTDERLEIIEERLERLEEAAGIAPERISADEMARLVREGKAQKPAAPPTR